MRPAEKLSATDVLEITRLHTDEGFGWYRLATRYQGRREDDPPPLRS
jgi:hypothetical protein